MLVFANKYLYLAIYFFFNDHLPCCGILDYIRAMRSFFEVEKNNVRLIHS